jgi:hypothetical protein
LPLFDAYFNSLEMFSPRHTTVALAPLHFDRLGWWLHSVCTKHTSSLKMVSDEGLPLILFLKINHLFCNVLACCVLWRSTQEGLDKKVGQMLTNSKQRFCVISYVKLRLKLKSNAPPAPTVAANKFRIVVSSSAVKLNSPLPQTTKPKRSREDTEWYDKGAVIGGSQGMMTMMMMRVPCAVVAARKRARRKEER